MSNAANELQADALVQAIEQQVATERRARLEVAEREAQGIAEKARDKVRRQQLRAIEELRLVEGERRRQLQAEMDTAARRQAASQAHVQLEQAWPLLRSALARRWTKPSARQRWIEALIALAASRLPNTGWKVRHPLDWRETDQRVLEAALQHHGMQAAAVQADATLEAGVVIETDGARLDGSPPAMLADAARVEAALLAALQSACEAGA